MSLARAVLAGGLALGCLAAPLAAEVRMCCIYEDWLATAERV